MHANSNPDRNQVEVRPVAVLPTSAGFAVFLIHDGKTGVIFVDPSIGLALPALAGSLRNQRPLTHDLVADLAEGFGIRTRNICITSADNGIFKARLVLEMSNEACVRKIVELDARSSDAIALSLRLGQPLHMVAAVWNDMEDVSDHYRILREDKPENEMIDLTNLP